jgi:hypothetical protein
MLECDGCIQEYGRYILESDGYIQEYVTDAYRNMADAYWNLTYAYRNVTDLCRIMRVVGSS